MTLPEWLRDLMPEPTARAWPVVASVLPDGAALYGGTGLAVCLWHRVSNDLDVFCPTDFDPGPLVEALSDLGAFALTDQKPGTLNGVFDRTKVQFLSTRGQRILEDPEIIAGMPVASLPDLIATKLQAVLGRGELRDYYDLKRIEQITGRLMEEGIALHHARYQTGNPDQQAMMLTRALGSFTDVVRDPTLPERFEEITGYWQARQPEIAAHLDRYGVAATLDPLDDIAERMARRPPPEPPDDKGGPGTNQHQRKPPRR